MTAALRLRCKSALTGLLRWLCVHSSALRICLPRHPHGNKARSAGLVQSGRRKGDSPGQVFLCSLSLWLLRSFFFLFSGEMRPTEGERRDGGMERHVQGLSADHACAALHELQSVSA